MRSRAFIIAPNMGFHMGLGGGVRTALAIAKLLEKLGYQTYLVALRGYNVLRLASLHGIKLINVKTLYFLGEGDPLRLPFPLQISLLKSYLEKALARYRPELVVFNDDIPILNEKILSNTRVVLYSHFPYAARIKFNVADSFEIQPSYSELYRDVLYRRSLRRLIYINQLYRDTTIISNSTVTRIFIELLWRRSPSVVYPPLIAPQNLSKSPQNKDDLVVVLATIQPNKRVGEVIRAFNNIRNNKARLVIIGHKGPEKYMRYINELIKQTKNKDKVITLTDIGESAKWKILAKSKVIVSAAHFEPFGISVIEGMYAENIPIVFKGPFSGPWIDIVRQGKHGLGFRDVKELAELIDIVLHDYDVYLEKLDPGLRAEEFGFERFASRLYEIVQ